MMGETSYYYPSAIYCRRRWKAGDFGRFVYGEGAYCHDMSHGFYDAFRRSGGGDWKRVAGFPPMFYPTHSTSLVLSVTGARMTSATCLEFRESHEDGIFIENGNLWNNPFSNATALFRTSDGGMCRVNEFRRIGGPQGPHGGVLGSIFGTDGVFEQCSNAARWTSHDEPETGSDGLNRMLTVDAREIYASEWLSRNTLGTQSSFLSGKAPIHPVDRLPTSFAGLPDAHMGSHQFLVHDFCRAVAEDRLPPNHVWDAARYNAPGIVAHQSALREGEPMPVPDFGGPPLNQSFIEPVCD